MENIQEKLKVIEQSRNIKILYACETGSRAWGFPSPDSDFDIRFLYMHERDWYLSLFDKKDTIEFMDGDLDITGWDLKKSLKLLKKSNAPLIERFQSPIEYYAVNGFKDNFKELIKNYYSPIAVFFHHYSLAVKFWEDIKDKKEIKLKSCFYLIRSLLSCNWVIKDNNVLPMDIHGLMKYTGVTEKDRLTELIELKSSVGEKYLYQMDTGLHNWITELFQGIEVAKNNIAVNNNDMVLLNQFFLKMVYAKSDD